MTKERLKEVLLNLINVELDNGYVYRDEYNHTISSLAWLINAMDITKEEAIEIGLKEMYGPEMWDIWSAAFEENE